MTVQELIEELSKIKDKTKKIKYFDSNLEDGNDIHSFNKVYETKYDGFDVVTLEWVD